jgi:hypothetical protein
MIFAVTGLGGVVFGGGDNKAIWADFDGDGRISVYVAMG